MPIEQLLNLVGKNVTIALPEVLAFISGQAISVPVQPLNEAVAGKTLIIALDKNAITLQLH